MVDDIYHGCQDCTWPETVWSQVFSAYLCAMCMAKRTENDLAKDFAIGTVTELLRLLAAGDSEGNEREALDRYRAAVRRYDTDPAERARIARLMSDEPDDAA